MYRLFGKRLLDLALATTALTIAAPVLLVVVGLLLVFNKQKLGEGRVFFLQQRPGLGGRAFTIYKFKTMTDERNEAGQLLPDEMRLTAIGNFVRKTSLDELLQLINVIKGEMSLVGPRPLLMRYLPLYSPAQAKRHDVQPGITGLAQVKGRNALSWERRFRYDTFYARHVSFAFDVQIMIWTLLTVFRARGIEFSPDVTWEFTGSKKQASAPSVAADE